VAVKVTVNLALHLPYITDFTGLSTHGLTAKGREMSSPSTLLVGYAILSGVLGGIRGYTAYTNLRVFLTAYTHLSDHK